MTEISAIGKNHELAFWERFVKTERFLEGWVRKVKTPELNDEVADFIKGGHPNQKVLDVGSGVVSILHGLYPGIRLTAADPLSPDYEKIFDYRQAGIAPPDPYAAEDLPYEEEFHIVHCSNALDHCADPEIALKKMFEACKPGGRVVIQGFENEAIHENYQGFHQWNLGFNSELKFSVGGIKKTVVYDYPTITAKTITLPTGRNWIIWIAQKQ